jgi:hypothetical protein
MATLTIAIDPELLEAAKLEAERRNITLDELVADKLAAVALPRPARKDSRRLIELMYSSPLGKVDKPLTREEIYAERSWPRS